MWAHSRLGRMGGAHKQKRAHKPYGIVQIQVRAKSKLANYHFPPGGIFRPQVGYFPLKILYYKAQWGWFPRMW